MSGKSKASKEQASSANPLSDLSSGANSAVLSNNSGNNGNTSNSNAAHTPTPSSAKSRKSPIESKAQKPSFLSLIFCCGANFVNDSDALQVVSSPSRPATVSIGKTPGKKPVAGNLADEKNIPPQPTVVDVTATAGPEESEGEQSHSQEVELTGLLGPIAPEHIGKKCLVLDLDETLVHSSFKLIPQADYVVPVEIDNQSHNVYVIKRPGVDTFLQKMGELYEVVIFTASLSMTNAVPISSWFNDPHDTELLDLIPFLADMTVVDDVNPILDMTNEEQP
ncbi:hypothetical protein BGZ49_010329 [Haplosporangium sp. Z 27]|nr:hypothetical protein BGZ49_010329 [Haplosporangium sp. Z 27]